MSASPEASHSGQWESGASDFSGLGMWPEELEKFPASALLSRVFHSGFTPPSPEPLSVSC